MFKPDSRLTADSARNKKTSSVPIYEHVIAVSMMEKILGKKFEHLASEGYDEKLEFYDNFCEFHLRMGYDAPSFECCAAAAMPGGGSLGGHVDGVIKTRKDFDCYPWDKIPDIYFGMFEDEFRALRDRLPEGMKAVGGVGNGVFELVQDITGFIDLCYIRSDDPELYRDLFEKAGSVLFSIWERFLPMFDDMYCVYRFGDDLGYKTGTMLPEPDIRELIVPQYERIIKLIHSYNKPFLLHSCGNIFGVMEDIINKAGIDAKHSNEDVIAPFDEWIKRYGDLIGNFGGLDTDVLCDICDTDVEEYTTRIYRLAEKKNGGVALGCGNSIPYYVSVDKYRRAVDNIRTLRGR